MTEAKCDDVRTLTWCSFASEAGNLGILLLEGDLDPIQASLTAHLLKQNPGGQLLAVPFTEAKAGREFEALWQHRGRLMTWQEVDRICTLVRVDGGPAERGKAMI